LAETLLLFILIARQERWVFEGLPVSSIPYPTKYPCVET
jgi:hypothetical protein